MPRDRWSLIYGNRYVAASHWLGLGLLPRLPWMLLRDLLDLRKADREQAAGIREGWRRAVRGLGRKLG